MTKTMKKVLTVLLVSILALSASFMGIFSGSADAASKTAFEGIIQGYITAGRTITDADLADEDIQVDLIQAKAYYDKMERAERESVPAVIAEEWEAIQNVAGPALTVYSAMASLSIYLRPTDAPRISVHKQAELDDAKLRYEALGADSNSELFCDMRIAYDYSADPASDYAVNGTAFFADLQTLIDNAQAAIDAAIAAINEIWSGVEVIGLDKEDEIDNATAKIEAVLPADRAEITNMADYEEAVAQLAAIKAHALELANDIDALVVKDRVNFDGNEIYYTKKADIDALNDRYEALEETTANAVKTYFQTEHATQYAKLNAMLAYCDMVEGEIAAVIEAIDAIGTVTYTAESKAKIDAAQALFNALDNDVKTVDYVTNLAVLDAAQARYVEIKTAVDAVVALIDAIDNPVTLTNACNEEIIDAEEAYAALAEVDDEFQANVPEGKVAIMEDARAEYIRLENIVKAWIARVEAFYGEGAIADIWAADLVEIADLEAEYAAFDANAKAYADNNGATADLADIKVVAYANIDETQAAIDALATTAPDAIVEKLLEAKEMFDTLHATQQAEIDKTVLNEKWAKYQAVSYFDKAVAVIKANVDANLYYTQDVALMNTLFVLYNVLDEEGRAMVSSYADLVAIEAVLSDATLVNAYEYNERLSNEVKDVIEQLTRTNEEVIEKNDALSAALAKANSTATIAMVIAILAVIAGVVGIVLATKKN